MAVNRPGHGGNLVWAAALAGCPPSSLVDFSASINPLGPPQSAIAAIQSHLGQIAAYPDPNYGDLRAALGEYHQIPPEWILPGNGAAELLTWAGWDLSTLPSVVLVTPAFGDYWRCLRAFKAKIVESCLWAKAETRAENFEQVGIDQLLLPSAEGSGLLINNPHNPSGRLLSRETLLPYLDRFELVVVDEAFMDFLPPTEPESLINEVAKFPNLVILRSLTKFYSLPGLRLGYAIAHPDRLKRWQQWRDPWPVNVLAAAVGVAVLQDTDFQQQTWSWLPPTRDKLFQGFSQLPGLTPYQSAANFLLVKTQPPSSELQQALLQQHRILIRDCLSFPELGDRYFRVAVRDQPENLLLLQGLKDVLS
jgi:L-threonine-O-3-phosphate decarboxylase